MASEGDNILAFREALAAAGVPFAGKLEADGELHRYHVEGDKTGRRNGWYILHLDGHPAGQFGSFKHLGDEKITWTAKGSARLTPLEREELERKRKAAAADRARKEALRHKRAAERAGAIWNAATDAVSHPYAERKGIKLREVRVGTFVREMPMDPSTGEVPEITVPNTLFVPIFKLMPGDEAGKPKKALVGLQMIFPEKVDFQGELRDKDFIYGSEKRGCYFSMGKPKENEGRRVFIICEGFATGASIHEATGHCTIIAFDAGNLGEVARNFLDHFPTALVIIAGDNDAWTAKPNGELWNVGVEKATKAASAASALLAVPVFRDLAERPTDFNDLHRLEGLAEVNRQIMEARPPGFAAPVAPEPAPEPEPAVEAPPEAEVEHAPWEGEEEFAEATATAPAVFAGAKLLGETPPNDHFRVFGYDKEYIWHSATAEGVVRWTARTRWNKQSFMALAPLSWWTPSMTGRDGSIDVDKAFMHVHGLAQKAGYFMPSRLRGRGAWRDGERTIYHLGDKLLVDGQVHNLDLPDSQFIYDRGERLPMPAAESLSDDDGRRIVAMAERFSWATPASSLLLAGWCALAPVCGALKWRPHIWITGGAGSGKSTILDSYVQFLMNGVSVFAQGNSTEAGIRQTLGCDAVPVLLDEAEQNNEREAFKIQNILSSARQSSSEVAAQVLKGTVTGQAMYFQVRSMFCFCSIQVGMTQQADMERIAVLALRPKRGSGDAWPHIRDGLDSLRADKGLPSRLFRRALDLLPTTLKNIEVFGSVAAKRFGSQRHGDQFGTLLAGAWSLMSREVATPDQAVKLIEAYDWTGYLESTETEESEKALNALLGRFVEVARGARATVHEVITRASGREAEGLDLGVKDANAILRRNGMMVRDGRLFVSNTSHALKKLMSETAYAADLRGQLLRVPGVEKHDSPERFGGERTKALKVPLAIIMDGYAPDFRDVDDDLDF